MQFVLTDMTKIFFIQTGSRGLPDVGLRRQSAKKYRGNSAPKGLTSHIDLLIICRERSELLERPVSGTQTYAIPPQGRRDSLVKKLIILASIAIAVISLIVWAFVIRDRYVDSNPYAMGI
jgi:hypothetical protein